MSISHGMNLAEIEALGRSLQDRFAAAVRDAAARIDQMVGSTSGVWQGPDSEQFRSWWPDKRQRLLAMADDLHGFGQSALNNVTEQRGASEEAGPGSTPALAAQRPSGAGNTPRSTRLDSPEARAHILDRETKYLQNSRQRDNFGRSFAKADAWLAELRQGNPTPEQVAGFESYMATLKIAAMQQTVVRDAAEHAYSQMVEAAKSGASVIGASTAIGKGPFFSSDGLGRTAEEVGWLMRARASEGFKDLGTSMLGGAIEDGIVRAASIDAIGAEAMVQRYLIDADAAVSGLESNFRQMDRVGHSDALRLATTQYEVFAGQRDAAIQKAEFADAFTPFTGDGSAVDSGLRAAIGVVGGPAARKTLDGLGMVGGTAQTHYHLQSAAASLSVAENGLSSVYEVARTLGAAK